VFTIRFWKTKKLTATRMVIGAGRDHPHTTNSNEEVRNVPVPSIRLPPHRLLRWRASKDDQLDCQLRGLWRTSI
jgi:hypothetical protein